MVRLDLSESEMQIVLGAGRLRFLKKQIKNQYSVPGRGSIHGSVKKFI